MGLTSALNTSLNGLTLNETSIDVLGNNIANAGTNGFKASKVLFETQLSRTLSVGSRPTPTNGGTNPRQIGLGANTAAITKDFTQGSITNSTSPSDLAIQGDGFFVLDGSEGNVYTRNGNFSLNSESLLTNAEGLRVQGYGIDDDFNLVTTQLSDISIPLGNLNVAQQTRNIELGGALLSTGDLATQGSLLQSDVMFDAADAGPNNFIDGSTFLTDVQISDGAGGFIDLFTDGETLSFAPRKGGRVLPAQTLDVATGATTVGDLVALMDNTLGITSGGGIPDDPNAPGGPAQPGISVDATTGQLSVVGNMGTVNDIALSVGDLIGANGTVPLSFDKLESATGESTILDFVVFDSLGQTVNVQMSAVLESRNSTSTTFRYFIESADDSDTDISVDNGTIQFDSVGKVIGGGSATFAIDRNNTAAVSPMQIQADFSKLSGISTVTAGSALSLQNQDGSNAGTLTSFVIDETGIINGIFDNGIIRTLGQVVLARFSNPQGLLENGGGTFQAGVSSGSPFLVTPGSFGAGSVRSGAIELSNTDIGRNLVDLIVASTNYRGNARVISSVQQLVDELLVLGR